jgi:hypothetical protein
MEGSARHLPAEQISFEGHTEPQAPQFDGSVCVVTHDALLQSVQPGAHASPHCEPEQVAKPLAAAGHEVVHVPHATGLLDVSRHALPQLVVPAKQRLAHAPAVQTANRSPAVLFSRGHALPQAPQFPGEVVTSTHAPEAAPASASASVPASLPEPVAASVPESAEASPPASLPASVPASVPEPAPVPAVAHRVSGAGHAATQPVGAHNPAGGAHWTLHAVHVAGLLRSASQPSAGLPLQSAHPVSHAATAHPCAPQPGCACARTHA